MQVNTTPRRARIPEDEGGTRTVRPHLEMSTLISELCEREVPEIDWEKLGEYNSSVCDIFTGLRLYEAQVKAGRETEVKRMLEFEVCEEVSEELARGKRIWNSAWLDSQKEPGLVRSRLVHQVRGACKREDVFAATPRLAAIPFNFSRAVSRGRGRCLGLWEVCGILPCSDRGRSVCSSTKEHAEGQDHLETLESNVWHTGCKFTLAKIGAETLLCDGHWKNSHKGTVCCIQ